MRHNVKGNRLGRYGAERKALLRALAIGLIVNGKLRTTVAKAKAIRPFVEPLVTKAVVSLKQRPKEKDADFKARALAQRRIVASRLNDPPAVKKLFSEIGPKYQDRKGGYTRIVKLSGFRRGDAAELAEVQWI